MTKLMKKSKRGFTLVELVIVIAILAILAAVAIPTVSGLINTANTNVDVANAQTIELALKSADAQRESGTSDANIATLTDTSTVAEVLQKSGITMSVNASSEFQSRAGGHFYYTNDKTIGVTTATLTSDQHLLLSTTTMKTIFTDWK